MFAMRIGAAIGELTLGGVNKAKYRGEVTWLPVDVDSQGGADKAGFWLAPLDAFTNSKSKVDLWGPRARSTGHTSVMIDSGTTGIIVDQATAEGFHNDPAAVSLETFFNDQAQYGKWAIPCDGSYGGTFTFGRKAFPIKGDALIGGVIQEVTDSKHGVKYCQCKRGCTPSLPPILTLVNVAFLYTTKGFSKDSHWILGNSFMEGVYTVFSTTP